MKLRYYSANVGEALLQVTTKLGQADLTIAVSDKYLNWKSIYLSAEQTEGLIKFLNESVIK
jgi:hypothetical protein